MSKIGAEELTDKDGNRSIKQKVIYSGTAKAWTNINGDGVISERDSFGMSSYADNANGDYSFNLSVPMSSNNFATQGSTDAHQMMVLGNATTLTSVRIECRGSTGLKEDAAYGSIVVFGDFT